MINVALKCGADEVTFKVIKNVGNAKSHPDILPSPTELRDAFAALIIIQKAFMDRIAINFGEQAEPLAAVAVADSESLSGEFKRVYGERSGCNCGDLSVCIKPNGDVTPCSYIPYSVENVLEAPLADIWHDSLVLSAIRKEKQNGSRTACEGCSSFRSCGAGCLAQSLMQLDGPLEFVSSREKAFKLVEKDHRRQRARLVGNHKPK